MVLRLYVDLMSQPCRAVALFIRANAIPCEEITIAIRKKENQTQEYAKINPFLKVPAIDHDGFKITESVAILQYLCREFSVPDHWYPKDIKKKANVNSYMAWHHLNLRFYGSQHFRFMLSSITSGKPADKEKKLQFESGLKTVLGQMDSIWLKDRPFIATDDLTIADLMAITELEQPGIIGFDVRAGHTTLARYMDLVKSRLQPHYDEVHSIVHSTTERMKSRAQAKL